MPWLPHRGSCHANSMTEGVSYDRMTLPQSKIGSEKPIFASPLWEGAKRRRSLKDDLL